MTGSLAVAHAAAASVETTLPAVGVQRAAWLLLAFPLFGAIVLLVGGKRTDRWGHLLGVAMPLAAFVYAVIAFAAMLGYPGGQRSRDLNLYSWIAVGTFKVNVALQLDQLSICFVLLITGVGSLIHIFSVGYMAHDPGRRRFFGYMNLFLAAMLLLVLADNYLVLYAGWEGVGLASYLLIGFWQYKPTAAVAAKKAFIANRVGDAGLSLAIMLMFTTFGTVSFAGVFSHPGRASSGVLTAIGLLLLLGACGKSAQLPLQSWLLDAMEGPTPVSALIHAATMVTAGVYLIVRSGPLFDLSADARLAVMIVGAATLLFGAIISCAKDDIKKALAGSTMSQIGYMMLAAGIGPAGYPFAIALLLAHGFFKAGLFLDAGSIMHGMNDEVDMRRYGGLAAVMRITFITFGACYLAIIGIPPFSGFFAKDTVIDAAFHQGGTTGWIVGICAVDRRGPHRVLHDPGDVHDVRREAPLGGRRPPARGAAGDDLAGDRAVHRGRGVRSLGDPGRPAGRLPRPRHRVHPARAGDLQYLRHRGARPDRRRGSGSPGRCTGAAPCRAPPRPPGSR